jgi:molybdenum cofactor synthesis domain-containing protein
MGTVVSVNISMEKGTVKNPVAGVNVNPQGITDDAHAGDWHRQVSLLSEESILAFGQEADRVFNYGDFAENITTRGLDLSRVAVLDRFIIGTVELEITQLGKHCHGDGCAIFREVGKCVMPKAGIFCRVLKGGSMQASDTIQWVPRPLRIKIITLSDRASRGVYDDVSGPAIENILETFFRERPWHCEVDRCILSDDAVALEKELLQARDAGVDAIFTTGGTGISSRDITPEVVMKMADKTLPGIMEYIRIKHGEKHPNALLSRSVAAVSGKTLIYALPGSVRAVNEYMAEILKTLEHCILMLHDISAH